MAKPGKPRPGMTMRDAVRLQSTPSPGEVGGGQDLSATPPPATAPRVARAPGRKRR